MFQGRYKAVPVNDADGNMTTGPVTGAAGLTTGIHAPASATLKWDAENHLIQASVGGTTVDYAYDYLSRLIARTQGGATTYYLYDGWNRIAEYSGTTLSKVYTWGLDLSGTSQGAGGVGGLLCVLDISSGFRYYPSYDGNGNVSEYITTSSGQPTQAAHFEYDPFGNLTADTGGHAADFPFRFSSKPQDSLTGLLYYGYRWYDPLTGRWPSRDPIQEQGGMNIYGFVGNRTVQSIDFLGLAGSLTGKCEVVYFIGHGLPRHSRVNVTDALIDWNLKHSKENSREGHLNQFPAFASGNGCQFDGSNGSNGIGNGFVGDVSGGYIGYKDKMCGDEFGGNGGMNTPLQWLDETEREKLIELSQAQGFISLIKWNWGRTLIIADVLADDCSNCECEKITARVRFTDDDGKSGSGEFGSSSTRKVLRDSGYQNGPFTGLRNLKKGEKPEMIPTRNTDIEFDCQKKKTK